MRKVLCTHIHLGELNYWQIKMISSQQFSRKVLRFSVLQLISQGKKTESVVSILAFNSTNASLEHFSSYKRGIYTDMLYYTQLDSFFLRRRRCLLLLFRFCLCMCHSNRATEHQYIFLSMFYAFTNTFLPDIFSLASKIEQTQKKTFISW